MYMYICTCVHTCIRVYFDSMLLYNNMSVFSKCVYTGVQRSMYMYVYFQQNSTCRNRDHASLNYVYSISTFVGYCTRSNVWVITRAYFG